MRKQAVLAENRARFVNPKGLVSHADRVTKMRGLNAQQGVIDEAVSRLQGVSRGLGRDEFLNAWKHGDPAKGIPAPLHDSWNAVEAHRLKVDGFKDLLRRQSGFARKLRGLGRRTLPRIGAAAGLLGAAGLGAYAVHKATKPVAVAPPVPAMQPLKRNKLMDALYNVFNVEPNLPAFEPVKQSTDNRPAVGDNCLTAAWAEGFDKYCADHGIDSVELVAALLPETDMPDKRVVRG